MATVKKIGVRLGVIAALLISFNFIYVYFLHEKDLQHYSPIVNTIRSIPDETDILYLGESSNITFSLEDKDIRKIHEFISDYLPEPTIADITKVASHAGIYKTILSSIPQDKKIKTIVVTLNLRSFNAQWIHSGQETALRKSMVMLEDYPPFMNRLRLSFKAYDYKEKDVRRADMKAQWKHDEYRFPYEFPYANVIEWDQAMAATGTKDEHGKVDSKTDLACHYIKAYGFQIDTAHHPRIDDFNEIIQLAQQRGWNLIFNLLAENTQKAETLVGKDLTYLMNENGRILKDYFTQKGVTVVDNLNSIDDSLFIDQNWTTEHYYEEGRKIIAKNLAEALKIFHP